MVFWPLQFLHGNILFSEEVVEAFFKEVIELEANTLMIPGILILTIQTGYKSKCKKNKKNYQLQENLQECFTMQMTKECTSSEVGQTNG